MRRPSVLSIALLGAVASTGTTLEARAQDGSDDGRETAAEWHFSETRKGFCVQLLLDPAKLRDLPSGMRLLPAEGFKDLHPVLQRVISTQPEFKSWSPSSLCFYYLTRVTHGSKTIGQQEDPAKAPVLGIWTVAGDAGASGPGNVVLDFRSNDGDLREAAGDAGLDADKLDSRVGPVLSEDGTPRPNERRYEIKFGKTLLVWDGRGGEDTTRTPPPASWHWRAPGENRRWVAGDLTLKAANSVPMVGSLRVEGKDAMARALQASPIRYVGPSYEGGEGDLRLH
ncbi:MAG TPA: hypothetical protein VJQ44_18140 [Gemmatimonadales bacterium]|nr:hypothetical protein [Gemmatimonadales bacterium]